MAKYLTDSTDIEIEEVSGTENLRFNLASGNAVEQMIGDLSNLTTTDQTNVVNAINEVNNSTIYSTTEIVVGKWIDNKPIYRKVISNLTTVAGTNNISLSSVSSDLDTLITMAGKTIQSSGNKTNIPYYSGTNDFTNIYYRDASTQFVINCGSNYGFGTAFIIFEYTKTTD